MFDNKESDGDRGQVGIGTLIVFIAMVLVAAIAAGVLINTAGFLQTSAEDTGDQSQAQVTDRVEVPSSVGNVADNASGSNETGIDTVNLTVTKAPGAEAIALEEMTIHWLGPNGADTLTFNESPSGNESLGVGEFSIESIVAEEPDSNILYERSDQFKVVINVANTPIDGGYLAAGDSVTLTFTTASGAERVVGLTVPETLAVYDDGDAIAL